MIKNYIDPEADLHGREDHRDAISRAGALNNLKIQIDSSSYTETTTVTLKCVTNPHDPDLKFKISFSLAYENRLQVYIQFRFTHYYLNRPVFVMMNDHKKIISVINAALSFAEDRISFSHLLQYAGITIQNQSDDIRLVRLFQFIEKYDGIIPYHRMQQLVGNLKLRYVAFSNDRSKNIIIGARTDRHPTLAKNQDDCVVFWCKVDEIISDAQYCMKPHPNDSNTLQVYMDLLSTFNPEDFKTMTDDEWELLVGIVKI